MSFEEVLTVLPKNKALCVKILFRMYQIFGMLYLDTRGTSRVELKVYCALVNIFITMALLKFAEVYITNNFYERHLVGRVPLGIEFISYQLHSFTSTVCVCVYNKRIHQVFFRAYRMKLLFSVKFSSKFFICFLFLVNFILIQVYAGLFAYQIEATLDVQLLFTLGYFFQYVIHLKESLFLMCAILVLNILKGMNHELGKSNLSVNDVKHFRMVYNKLCLLTLDMNGCFKTLVTSMVGMVLVELWACCFMILHLLLRESEVHIFFLLSNVLTVIYQTSKLFTIVNICEKVDGMTNNMQMQIHKLMETPSYFTSEFLDQVELFSLQLFLERVKFRAHGFVLNNSVMFTVISTIFTYMVVLLQYQFLS